MMISGRLLTNSMCGNAGTEVGRVYGQLYRLNDNDLLLSLIEINPIGIILSENFQERFGKDVENSLRAYSSVLGKRVEELGKRINI